MTREQSTGVTSLALSKVAAACIAVLAVAPLGARADQASDLQARLDALQRQVQDLQAQVKAMSAPAPVAPPAAAPPVGAVQRSGAPLTFTLGDRSEVTLYGHVDVSADVQTTGLKKAVGATGNNGWVADVSSNLSSFGTKGLRRLDDDLTAVFQFETEVSVAATPGASDQAPDGTAQKSGLGSRNSHVGLQSARYGAIKLGKNDSPYKSSTARLDPFSNTVADYNSIMGNTGGDARAEFDLRLPHAVWYESPRLGGVSGTLLVSPGQNRSTQDLQYALGEPDCTGGNSVGPQNPASGCNDGSFGAAYSASLAYEAGPLYLTAAWELHRHVNREGDDLAPGSVGIADESAFKIGAQYALLGGTTFDFAWERMKRDAITRSLDERTRNGTWFAVVQKLTAADEVAVGWAHAFRTPGNPNGAPPNMQGIDGSAQSVDNSANQYSLLVRHRFPEQRVSVYAVYTNLHNDDYAHYALGVSGHGIVTRNKDGDGNTFSGYDAQAVSLGMTYDF